MKKDCCLSFLFQMTSKMKSTIAKIDDQDNWDSLSITSGLSDDYDMLSELANQDEEAAFISNHTGGLNDDEQESVLSGSTIDRPKQPVCLKFLINYESRSF